MENFEPKQNKQRTYSVLYNRNSNQYQQYQSKTQHELGSILSYGFDKDFSPWHFLQYMQQADAQLVKKAANLYLAHIDALEPQQSQHYILRLDMCINHPENYCYRLLVDASIHAYDAHNWPWLIKCEHELISKPTHYIPASYSLINLQTDAHSHFPELPLDNYEQLSSQEIMVLKLVQLGQSSKQIALSLNISPHTVSTHRQNIIRKTNTNNIGHATVYAQKIKVIPT